MAEFTDESEDDSEEEDEDLDEDALTTLTSEVTDLFGLVICDEAHKLKSVQTRTHRSVQLMRPERLLLVTATICGNQAGDIKGIVSLMYGVSTKNAPKATSTTFETEEDYKNMMRAIAKLPAGNLERLDLAKYRNCINPASFRAVTGGSAIEIDMSISVVRPILSLIMLRRNKGQVMRLSDDPLEEVTVGGDIPPYHVVTVELQMGQAQAELYSASHQVLANGMGTGADPQTGEGWINMGRHRWLSHAAFNASLDRFRSKAQTGVKHVDRWHEKGVFGSVFYHRMTRGEDVDIPYRDRISFAIWMSQRSVKLQWLAGFLLSVVLGKQEKVLLFTEWPVVQYNVELFLLMVNIEFVSIRSVHTQAQRDQVVSDFNDPAHPAKVCVTSYRCSSTSSNLQKSCHNIVMLEVPGSGCTTNQTIGRVWRMGQKFVAKIYLLTTDLTYDQVIQSRAAKKYYTQLAVTAKVGLMDNNPTTTNNDDDDNRGLNEDIMGDIRAYYMRIFSQRSFKEE